MALKSRNPVLLKKETYISVKEGSRLRNLRKKRSYPGSNRGYGKLTSQNPV